MKFNIANTAILLCISEEELDRQLKLINDKYNTETLKTVCMKFPVYEGDTGKNMKAATDELYNLAHTDNWKTAIYAEGMQELLNMYNYFIKHKEEIDNADIIVIGIYDTVIFHSEFAKLRENKCDGDLFLNWMDDMCCSLDIPRIFKQYSRTYINYTTADALRRIQTTYSDDRRAVENRIKDLDTVDDNIKFTVDTNMCPPSYRCYKTDCGLRSEDIFNKLIQINDTLEMHRRLI